MNSIINLKFVIWHLIAYHEDLIGLSKLISVFKKFGSYVVSALRKYWFLIILMILFAAPIILLLFLDYYNLEGFNYRFNWAINNFESWPNTFLIQNFLFELTWKGRMFYLLFLWLLFIELVIDWKSLSEHKPRNRYIILASLICALIPTIYVIAVNFFGLDLTILKIGRETFGVRSGTTDDPSNFLFQDWPLTCEYIVFTVFFLGATILAYGKKGLKTWSISFALIGGISIAYLLDTVYPFGVFKPLQEFTLPTAATTAALLDLLGYNVTLHFPYALSAGGYLPTLQVNNSNPVGISWACAGVQSLFLFVLIIAVFFKKSSISSFRKLAYFVIGLFGTFFVNVLRIFSYFIILLNYGSNVASDFHNTYGEMYFFTWMFMYVLLIVGIQRFMLIERTRYAFHVLPEKTRYTLHKLGSYSANKIRKLSSYLKTKLKQFQMKSKR
jgi:thaumarchaeosortase